MANERDTVGEPGAGTVFALFLLVVQYGAWGATIEDDLLVVSFRRGRPDTQLFLDALTESLPNVAGEARVWHREKFTRVLLPMPLLLPGSNPADPGDASPNEKRRPDVSDELDKDVVEFVRLGYHHNASLHFRVEVRNRATLEALIESAAAYFDPRQITDAIGPVFDDAWSVEFGREFRPVLYVVIPYVPNQRLGASPGDSNVRYSDEQRQDMTHRVIDWARSVGAAEIGVQQHPVTDELVENEPGDNPYMVRIWWD